MLIHARLFLSALLPLGAALLTLLVGPPARAADLPLGAQLDAAQRAAATLPQEIRSAGQTYRLLAPPPQTDRASAEPSSRVVNALSVVGLSRHEVLVARLPPAEVARTAAALGLRPLRQTGSDVTLISQLRFDSFAAAAAARDALARSLPQARVSLPIQYAEPRGM